MPYRSFLKLPLSLAYLALWQTAHCNNIQVRNISLENLNSTSNWVHIEFDLDWQNSWRVSSGPFNYDAAWVFAKYRRNGGTWTHCIFSQSNSFAPPAAVIDVPPDGTGAFIYRSADGNGTFDVDNIQLRWNFGSTDENDVIDIKVFAIEMVYIPQGIFRLGGTTGNEVNKFRTGGPSTSSPYLVSSENPINIANTFGNLYYDATNSTAGDQTGTLQASYPKGFNAFYCMKYEVSEGQWVEFFNCLTPAQQANRDITDSDGKDTDAVVSRNTISWTTGDATSSAPDRAISYTSPADNNAYMDWAALRPMTELEYEKACRGPVFPKAGEFAWGTSVVAASDYTVISANSFNERVGNPATSVGNAMYRDTSGNFSGPGRCGIFAASALSSTREQTGGSYYGVMELSGNLYERCITVGTPQGRAFTGNHGNGIISSTGSGTVSGWPNSNTGDGYSYRGGSWANSSDYLRVSDRWDGASVITTKNDRLGFRAVRTAP